MDQFAARRRMRGQGGFTLIELLVVVAILAVLGGAVIIGVGGLRGSATDVTCKTDKETVETAAEAYLVANSNVAPGSVTVQNLLDANLLKPKNDPNANFTLSYAGGSFTATPKGKYASANCT